MNQITEPVSCISLLQPWATLLVHGIKRNETRSRPTSFRGRLYIHASKGYDRAGEKLWNTPEIQSNRYARVWDAPFELLPRGQIIGYVNIISCMLLTDLTVLPGEMFSTLEILCGDYKPGRFAYIATCHTPILPIEAKGQLGIWRYDPNAPILAPKLVPFGPSVKK